MDSKPSAFDDLAEPPSDGAKIAATSMPKTRRPPEVEHDENYQVMCKARDQLIDIGNMNDRTIEGILKTLPTPRERISALRGAAMISGAIVELFGLGVLEQVANKRKELADIAKSAAAKAAAHSAFGGDAPKKPPPWITKPGDRNPERAKEAAE